MGTAHHDFTGVKTHIPGYRQAGDPGAVGAGRWWEDITDVNFPIYKIRDNANTGWIVLLDTAAILGDMLKSVYDTNNDTIVDAADEATHAASADAVPWAGITGIPATFAPSAHNTSHQSGGADAIKLDDLAAPEDNVDLNVSITAHGLAPKLSNNAAEFLNGVGAYSVPAGGSGDVVGPASSTDEAVARFDTATGKLLQNSPVTMDDVGNTDYAGAIISDLVLKNYGETVHTEVAGGSTETIDTTAGSVKDLTLTANCTLTFSVPATANTAYSFTLIVRQDGTGGWLLTYPASVLWPGGTEPTLTTTAGAISRLVFTTVDGGTTWFGSEAGDNFF